MITPKIVAEIRRLLAEGMSSQRRIARLTGVSRGTVGAIASGKRPDYDVLQQPGDDAWEEPAGPPKRCPHCGGRVYLPCQLCRVRRRSVKRPPTVSHGRAVHVEQPLEFNLRPEHRARFEEVRAWRRERGGVESIVEQQHSQG